MVRTKAAQVGPGFNASEGFPKCFLGWGGAGMGGGETGIRQLSLCGGWGEARLKMCFTLIRRQHRCGLGAAPRD